jgi:hypothetical protein
MEKDNISPIVNIISNGDEGKKNNVEQDEIPSSNSIILNNTNITKEESEEESEEEMKEEIKEEIKEESEEEIKEEIKEEMKEERKEQMKEERKKKEYFNELIIREKEEEIMRNELTDIKKIQDMEINKKYLELDYKKRLQQIKDNDDIDQKYFDLENGKRKNELKKQLDLISGEDTIELFQYDEYNKSCCYPLNFFTKNNIIDDFDKIYKIITNLPSITNYEKNLILLRFTNILTYCSRKYNRISKLYNLSQIFLIACSIINPALLSININTNNPYYNLIFWIVWGLQLMVSLITGYISLYKWDKKNFLFNIYKTKINQEIWFFIGLTGKYYTNIGGNYNHSDYINLFLNRLEKIYTMLKTSEFEMENSKDTDGNSNSNIRPVDILQSRVSPQR